MVPSTREHYDALPDLACPPLNQSDRALRLVDGRRTIAEIEAALPAPPVTEAPEARRARWADIANFGFIFVKSPARANGTGSALSPRSGPTTRRRRPSARLSPRSEPRRLWPATGVPIILVSSNEEAGGSRRAGDFPGLAPVPELADLSRIKKIDRLSHLA